MGVVEKYLAELEELKSKTAIDSLANPASKDAYGLGVAVGIQQGLTLARSTLEKVLKGDEEDEPIRREGEEPLIRPKWDRTRTSKRV